MSFILFILIIGILVIIHEAGHMVIARLNGIRVIEFAVGMGPKLVGFKRGETVYTLRLLPIGGACIFDGEDGTAKQDEEGNDILPDEHSFQNAKVGARIATVLAGPVANFILAFILAIFLVQFSKTDIPLLTKIEADTPAAKAGLQEGDLIVEMNGENIHLFRQVSVLSQLGYGKPIDLVVERDGEEISYHIIPEFNEEENRYLMGIYGGEYVQMHGFDVVKYAFYEVGFNASSIYKSLLSMVSGQFNKKDVAGVVGIANIIDDTYEAVKPAGIIAIVLTMTNLALMFSVNLGILNLIPFPALDGGRLIFLLYELVTRKRIPPEKEGIVNMIGFLLLMILMIVLFFNDLNNFVFNK